ncbi:MAG: NAD(P)/FAD-dependent oxidoreductase [Nitrosomonas sp.]|uniref:NAD(P)/FAD-dependent oxidoreductase n=1 Tax=Nitrosomonas sp. TaxID=42353 RepID=UPI0032ED9252
MNFGNHSHQKINTVAILGSGPAACALAILLCRAGLQVAMWHKPKTAPLIVGESLVPAVIPMLQTLGVEDAIRGFSMFKPGATFNLSKEINFSFFFKNLTGTTAIYAYNVPRDKFDIALLEAAKKNGAMVYESPANLECIPNTDKVILTPDTLAATNGFFAQHPDMIVDATGRVRLLPKLLNIGSKEGTRKDTALFAHVDQTHLDYEGHVHTTRLDHGWSWRIPLPGRVSLGMVINSQHLPKFGETKEERYDNLLKQDSVLKTVAANAQRITPVMEYTNYQLISERMFGDGWVLVGDTAGFIDPVFSSGLFLGMQGAFKLAQTICDGSQAAFQQYENEEKHHLKIWQEIVSYYYDGRLFTCFKVGQSMQNNVMVKLLYPHIDKHMGRIFSGAASTSPYSVGLLRFITQYGMKGEDPSELMIR